MLDSKVMDWKVEDVIVYKMCIFNVLKLLKFIDCSIVMKLFVGGKLLVIFYLCMVQKIWVIKGSFYIFLSSNLLYFDNCCKRLLLDIINDCDLLELLV